jgi:hypothetical protein
MSSSRPEAESEYSRGDRALPGASRRHRAGGFDGWPRGRIAVAAGSLAGAALLVGAELTPLLTVLGDLPDAHAGGLLRTSAGLVDASSSPSTGFYLETLGAVVLMLTAAAGLLLTPGGAAGLAHGDTAPERSAC